MQVLAHRQHLLFISEKGGDHFSLESKPTIQTAPDWIRGTETFKHATKAGLVVELNVVTPAAVAPVVESGPESETEPTAPADVAGLSASNRPSPGRLKAKVA
jgi:hypothetical protein